MLGITKKARREKDMKKAAALLDKGYTVDEVAVRLGRGGGWVRKSGHKYSQNWSKRWQFLKRKKRR